MEEKILFVDDEENILSAFRRQLRKEFNLETANHGPRGLEVLSAEGPFAVVISDFRMPGMDGVQFLKRVKEISPDTVRIMLTGYADVNTMIEAVNDGNIFRFLTKPCPTEALVKAIYGALEMYRLVISERDLLEKTLKTSVTILIDVLSMSKPLAFSRALRIRRIVRVIVANLKLSFAWQFEMAAMLSQIGCVALPQSILEKVNGNKLLNKYEAKLYASHPAIGCRLLENIHRLESITSMIKDQNRRYDDYDSYGGSAEKRKVDLGAQILHAAIDYDQLVMNGYCHAEAITALKSRVDEYNLDVLQALGDEEIIFNNWTTHQINAGSILPGMVLNENLLSPEGELIAYKYQEVTQTLLECIKVLAGAGAAEPGQSLISVYIPASQPAPVPGKPRF